MSKNRIMTLVLAAFFISISITVGYRHVEGKPQEDISQSSASVKPSKSETEPESKNTKKDKTGIKETAVYITESANNGDKTTVEMKSGTASSGKTTTGKTTAIAKAKEKTATATVSSRSADATTTSKTTAPKAVPLLPSKMVAGYYTAWSAYQGYTPDKINAAKLSVVHYAFAAIGSDYRITAGDPYIDSTNFIKLKAVKEKHPHLKILISVGGWGNSARFSDLALSAERRRVFAQSCVSFIKQYGFDGVDIDWEYPVSGGAAGRPEDKYNFTLMMKELRERLDEQAKLDGSYYYLSFAGGASSGYINNVQLGKLAGIVDYAVNMTYDLHGPWDDYADFNAPLFTPAESSPQYKISVDSSMKYWQNAGFPKNKLVMGIPFYGYVYGGVGSSNNGLYQRFSVAKAYGYDSIVSSFLSDSLYAKHFHPSARVSFLYGNGKFISYDGPASIASKAQYAVTNGLRGVSAWELGYDKSSALLSAAYQTLKRY
jgi:chitinase